MNDYSEKMSYLTEMFAALERTKDRYYLGRAEEAAYHLGIDFMLPDYAQCKLAARTIVAMETP